jgi:DNA polymerase-4
MVTDAPRERRRTILHVDMDAFFASVEVRDNPSLAGKPVLVGGPSKRGVVAAASYEARKFGIHSAMPMARALLLCKHAIVVSGRRERYEEVSRGVFAIFRRFTPLVEGLSLDEAFLDTTGSTSLFGDGPSIAAQIQEAIRRELDLSASAGVAQTKFVAKIASDFRKPGGITIVPDDEASFLAPLPIERMWGVGEKTAQSLRSHGIPTLGALARAPDDLLSRILGRYGAQAKALALGIDPRPVEPEREAKSIGSESTYEQDIADMDSIRRSLLAHSARVAERLVNEGLSARSVSVKLKYGDFELATRQTKLPQFVYDTQSIYRAACDLLGRFERNAAVRLTGVSVSDLEQRETRPRELFEDEARNKRERLEATRAQLRARFGDEQTSWAAEIEEHAERPVVVPIKSRV